MEWHWELATLFPAGGGGMRKRQEHNTSEEIQQNTLNAAVPIVGTAAFVFPESGSACGNEWLPS